MANKEQRQDEGDVSKCIKEKGYCRTRSQEGRGRGKKKKRLGVVKEKMKGIKDSGWLLELMDYARRSVKKLFSPGRCSSVD